MIVPRNLGSPLEPAHQFLRLGELLPDVLVGPAVRRRRIHIENRHRTGRRVGRPVSFHQLSVQIEHDGILVPGAEKHRRGRDPVPQVISR